MGGVCECTLNLKLLHDLQRNLVVLKTNRGYSYQNVSSANGGYYNSIHETLRSKHTAMKNLPTLTIRVTVSKWSLRNIDILCQILADVYLHHMSIHRGVP